MKVKTRWHTLGPTASIRCVWGGIYYSTIMYIEEC